MSKADASNTTNTPVDPIFAAISNHVEAISDLYRLVALFKMGEIDGTTITAGPMCQAAMALVACRPTTAAGLNALSEHILTHFGYASGAALCIHRPLPGGSFHGGGEGAAEWLIATRSAELGMRL